MVTPGTAAARIDPIPVSLQLMVIALVMVTVPKPPGSRQLISPPTAVLEIAPAKVLHGAVRLHGLASSPTPETQVREACAIAASGTSASPPTQANPSMAAIVFMVISIGPVGLILASLNREPGRMGRSRSDVSKTTPPTERYHTG